MAVNADTISTIIEMVTKYFKDLINPNMTIEKLAEVASPQLDKIIQKNEEQGLKYSAGKFKIEYLNDKQFTLEFEMYFKDEAGKWYKAANKSEPRSAELIEPSSWKTLKALKVVEFPIGAPASAGTEDKIPAEVKNKEVTTEPAVKEEISQEQDKVSSSNNDITLDKLMDSKK